jgi:cytochrome c oxidase subunit II
LLRWQVEQPQNSQTRLVPKSRQKLKATMKMIKTLGQLSLAISTFLVSHAAVAVNDLPGGPAVNQLDLPPPVTQIAADQRYLHYWMLGVCAFIFVGVFGVMFYSIFKHRKSKGAKPANFHESTTVEIIWTALPFFIVIGMALPATKVVVAMKDTSAADLTIKATGIQWKWGYDYLKGEGEGIGFVSTLDPAQREMSNSGKPPAIDDYLLKVDNPLVVPVNKKVRIITTANDVIHAFAVPAFGIKQDAIPGFVRDTWFRAEKVGDYHGQCQELCGKEHAYMPIHVKVVSQTDYTQWVLAKQKEAAALADDPAKVWTLPDLLARGEKVYANNCVACHQASGKGGGAIKALDGAAVVLDTEHAKQIQVLLNGQNNGAMPSWKQLSDTELAAVITYTKNNWSNKTGQLVQPAEVAAMRAGKTPVMSAAPAAPAATPLVTAPELAPAVPTAAATTDAAAWPVSVFFATGKSALDAAAIKAVAEAVEHLKATPDGKIALSGFVDSSGDPVKNAELAKERAKQVREALQKSGIALERIEMRKPEQITAASGDQAQARRVDIRPAS